MSPAAVVTLIGVALLVGALAVYLTTIALLLRKVSFHLGTILIGVRAIAHQCEPVGPVVDDIVDDIAAMEGALDGLLARAGRSTSSQPAPSRRPLASGAVN